VSLQAVLQKLKSATVRDTAVYMAGSVLGQGINVLVLPVFTRYLSPADYGIFNYTNSFVTFFAVFPTLSLNSFVLRFYFDAATEEERRRLFGTIYVFVASLGFGLLVLELLTVPVMIRAFNIRVPFYPYIAIALITSFLESLTVIPLALFRAKRRVVQFFLLTFGQAAIAVASGLVLIVGFRMGLLGRYYGVLVTDIAFAIITLVVMLRSVRFCLDREVVAKGLRFSLPLLPAAVSSVVMLMGDRIILERYVEVSAIGIYSVALMLGTAVQIVVMAFYRAVEPEIFSMVSRRGFKEDVVRMKNAFLMVIMLGGSLLIIFSREIVTLLVDERFYSSYVLIPFFVVTNILRGAKILVGVTFHAYKVTVYDALIGGIGAATSILANLALIPQFGILGAAMASIMTYWVLLIASTSISARVTDIRWGAMKDTASILVVVAVSVVVMRIEMGGVMANALTKAAIVLAIGACMVYRPWRLRLGTS